MKKLLTIITGAAIAIVATFVALPNLIALAAGSIGVSTNTLNIAIEDTAVFTIAATNAAGRVDITSSDDNIASVSTNRIFLDSGLENQGSADITVTGEGAGTATITVTVTDATTFDEDDLSTNTYTITVTVGPVVEEDEVLTLKPGNIMALRAGDLTDIEDRINAGAATVVLTHYDSEMNELETNTLSTGDIVRATIAGVNYDYTVSILGDAYGDGTINSADYIRIKNHIMETDVIEAGSAVFYAADINKDTNVTSLDYIKVRNYIMHGGNIWEV